MVGLEETGAWGPQSFSRNREGVRKGNGFGFGPMESDSVCTDVWLPLTCTLFSAREEPEGAGKCS